MTYYALILKSFIQYRVTSTSAARGNTTNVLGFTVAYSTLPVLIKLYEEIFIEGAYYFESKARHPAILDCGSNIGMSVLYFKMLYPESVITAFEPDATSFSLLERNVRENHLEHVTMIHAALGKKKSDQLLYTPSEKDASLNATLLPIESPIATTSVKVNCLSSFITGQVDCVKIDIEGSEAEVLTDLVASQKIDLVKYMVIEFHPIQVSTPREDFIKMIEEAGLKVTIRKESTTESLLECARP